MALAPLTVEIKSILMNDSLLTSDGSGLGFQIFDMPITAGRPASAFDPNDGNRMRKVISIIEGGEVEHPSTSNSKWRLWDSFPQIRIYAPAHANGKVAAKQAKLRVEQLLCGRRISAIEGVNITMKPSDEIALDDSELNPGNIVSIVRWRATGARALVEVQ